MGLEMARGHGNRNRRGTSNFCINLKKDIEFCFLIRKYHFKDHIGGNLQIIVDLTLVESIPPGRVKL